MKNYIEHIIQFDLKNWLQRKLNLKGSPSWSAFILSFLALNIVFIYFSKNYLFGDHDWRYLLNGVALDSGLFEGRFSQFLFINLLSAGEILPIINNALGFLGYCLGIVLLAKYWKVKEDNIEYSLFSLLMCLTPYLLSFMYFAFLVIPCLSWNFVIILSLIISAKEKTFSFIKTLLSSFLITLALGGYPPVINLLITAFVFRLLEDSLFEKATLKNLFLNYRYTCINILLGASFYKICLNILTRLGKISLGHYNLQTIPFSEWGEKFILVTKDIYLQFFITHPFITAPYKKALLGIVVLAFISFGLYIYNNNKKSKEAKEKPLLKAFSFSKLLNTPSSFISILLLIFLFYAPMITLFLSPSLKETEFSPRIDFFGFTYLYGACFLLTRHYNKSKLVKNLSTFFAITAIFIGANSIFEAEKVWKLGFDNEMSFHKRVLKRIYAHNKFIPTGKQYVIVAPNGFDFRSRFYHTPYKHPSEDLLSISYVPGMASGVMINYYAPYEFANTSAYSYVFMPDKEAQDFLYNADIYPNPNSIAIGNDWIIAILDRNSLMSLRQTYLR